MYQSPKSWPNIKNTVVLTIVTLWHIQCLHLMYAEVACVLVSSATQVQPQVIFDPDYLPDYLSLSYDYHENGPLISSTKTNQSYPCLSYSFIYIIILM